MNYFSDELLPKKYHSEEVSLIIESFSTENEVSLIITSLQKNSSEYSSQFTSNRMNLSDITRVIASYLDDDTLQLVFLSGAMPSLISVAQDQHFWYERVCTLTGRILPQIRGDWTRAYAILKQQLTQEEPGFVNEDDNPIVATALLAMGFDPSVNDNYTIRTASEHGKLEIVKVLFSDSRVDPSTGPAMSPPALELAAYGGHLEIVKLLLSDSRVDPTSALVSATYEGHLEVVKVLLSDSRTDPTPSLIESALGGREDIFILLIEDSRTDRREFNRALMKASMGGHDGIMRILLSLPEVDPSTNNNNIIQLASRSNNSEAVKLLLSDPRVDPSDRNNAPIRVAADSNNFEILELLLSDPRVDPTASGSHALKTAAERGREDIVSLLLQDRRQDRAGNNGATVRAINSGYFDLAKIIISSGKVDSDVVLKNILRDENVEIIEYILDRIVIDPSIRYRMILSAAERRQMEAARVLLIESDGKRIFSESIREGGFSLVRLLLRDQRINPSMGYDIDFIEAARRGHGPVILLLLRDGRIDPTVNNNQALKEARAEGKNWIVGLLLEDPRVQGISL